MADIIKLLPDNIANQIAAGEVVQRPSSAVKEMLENAVDAGANEIKLIIRDGGIGLIQVIDNGKGMSSTDARMCWERHATSKISKAEDLFAIRSFGFRGEALASIAAVAQVEMKTKRAEDELGTNIRIEASKVQDQQAIAINNGTNISVKNLFFNIPARRNFLKSQNIETRHIIDEFTRIAMAHPAIRFSFYNNDKEVFDLPNGTLKTRIAQLLGKSEEKLLSATETTDLINITGFIGRPDDAKRTRGEQFLFVNNRFIKDAYLHHAVNGAYEGLLEKDKHPLYILFLELNPARIDVNVHPTKTEIKFEDERAIYSIVKSVVRKALGQFMLIPEIDFGDAMVFNPLSGISSNDSLVVPNKPEFKTDKSYNPFQNPDFSRHKRQLSHWEKLYEPFKEEENSLPFPDIKHVDTSKNKHKVTIENCFQFHNTYIVASLEQRLYIIDQRLAHERILYEKYLNLMHNQSATTQQLLFPRTLEMQAPDFALVCDLLPEIKALGFDISEFGKNTFIINGTPAEINKGSEKELLEGLVEQFKYNRSSLKIDKKDNLARSLARHAAIKRKTFLNEEEITELVEQLFLCEQPGLNPSGKPVFLNYSPETLSGLL